MLDAAKTQRLRVDHRNRQVRWGFSWALCCAVLCGAWYVLGYAIYSEAPFVNLSETTGDLLLAGIAAAMAIFATLAAGLGAVSGAKLRQETMTRSSPPVPLIQER
ncbi:MAG: hypothetical protein GEU98_04175 [Pseudonocardiaceae bacterium]|nr:hypothetical protein [Pseudonocardiaceae bacterium]